MDYYIGEYKKDAAENGHRGWLVGEFMENFPFKTDLVEIKYWEYDVGPTNHDTKISGIFECTFILEGEISGTVDGKEVRLSEGAYVVIPPGIMNGFPQIVYKKVRGLTIKAPSDPSAKKVV